MSKTMTDYTIEIAAIDARAASQWEQFNLDSHTAGDSWIRDNIGLSTSNPQYAKIMQQAKTRLKKLVSVRDRRVGA